MIASIISTSQNNEAYLGEEWLMSGNLLTKYEFDKAFKLAKQTDFISLAELWKRVPFSPTSQPITGLKHEVTASNLILHQLRLVCDAFQKSGDAILETLISEFESKINSIAAHPFSFPACMNYPSNEKIKPVRYILCGDYKIVYQANKYFVHISFIAHGTRCKKLLKDKFAHW